LGYLFVCTVIARGWNGGTKSERLLITLFDDKLHAIETAFLCREKAIKINLLGNDMKLSGRFPIREETIDHSDATKVSHCQSLSP
jgi:hypothetical protein